MKRITLYTLLIAGIAVQATCKKDTYTSSEPEQIVQTDPSKKELLCRKWMLSIKISRSDYTYPYKSDTIYYSEDNPHLIIEFMENETYIKYAYKLDSVTGKITTDIYDGIWRLENNLTYLYIKDVPYSIKELNEDKLTLILQGREDSWSYYYEPVKQ